MTLGLVAVAFGQQAPPAAGNDQYLQPPIDAASNPAQPPGSAQFGRPGKQQWDVSRQPAMPAPQDRSVLTGQNQYQQDQSADSGKPRAELGIWMVESGGPGVAIQRVTKGSAAEQAGLREGDVILQVNGRGAASPQAAAQLIRTIQIGQAGTLTIWRDGDQKQLQVTMRERAKREIPSENSIAGESRPGHFGGENGSSSELASRTMKLEQQISSLTQELHQLRQELAQIRSQSHVQQTGFNSDAPQASPPSSAPGTTPPAAPGATAPPPGFGQTTVEKPATPAAPPAEAPKATTPPPATPPAATAPSNDLFGAPPAATKVEEKKAQDQPKADEKPKTDEKPKADDKSSGDDLFK
jgi:hypothetical protein